MVEGKQVKVNNWGIFFLQQLHKFYNKASFCDLTLQFEDNVQIKVHRLVMNACTEYFQMLENKCEVEKDCLMMPPNLPSDVVLPIINFMYSGILEFHESLFDRLYATTKLMNMSVLTKLLDAQKQPIKPVTPIQKRVQSVTPITWNLQGKKIMTKNFSEPELPETLPGRKLPIWKRKSAPNSVSFLSSNNSNYEYSPKMIKSEEPPKPTRFEWPDEDENNFENSFDEISYTSKPLIMPSQTPPKEKSPKPSTSTFDEIKKSGPVKRSASPIGNQCKKVNIQDVKEYLKEHKIRSDFIDYDDSETADNDLQTYDHDDSAEECSKDATDVFQQLAEDTPSKSILKTDSSSTPSNKHVRFSLEGKDIKKTPKPKETTLDMSKHTKIITEVLKKYPHLVKNKKNIRLKILAKGNNSPVKTATKTQVTPAKPASKVSYMVMKPETKSNSQPDMDKNRNNGPWECTRCEETKIFKSYHTYRQHLTEVHNEKQDSQMCILCGHISRKQNMLVYHKYVKHNVPPPAMYNFPKCKECNYIALSQALLNKHMLNHAVVNLTCLQCLTVFQNKHLFYAHIQQTGHSQNKSVTPQFSCNLCDKRFFSENILNAHIKRSHEKEIKIEKKEVKQEETTSSKSKEKIQIISDVQVNTPVSNLVPVGEIPVVKQETPPEPLEPSSEAEALSNVASGIAASLGLVDTIVVLDDNQFILQSHGNIQENILNNTGQEYIIPEMHMANLSTIANSNIQVTQPVTDTNTVLTQANTKPNITSTDELVMVLTDHDYSDAVNNTVMTDNNIVVLYSHPVQTQAMMINSETGLIEVNKNYAVAQEMSEQVVHCEESIEMIQQEINNQLEEANEQTVEYIQQDAQFVQNETNVEYQETMEIDQNTYQVTQNDVIILNEEERIPANNIEESIEMIQDEINKIPESETIKTELESQNRPLECTEMTNETISSSETTNIIHTIPLNQETCEYIVQSAGHNIQETPEENIPVPETNIQEEIHPNTVNIETPQQDSTQNETQQTDDSVVQTSQETNITSQETNITGQEIDIPQEISQEIHQLDNPEISETVIQMEQQIETNIQQLENPEITQPEMNIEQLETQETIIEAQELENQEIVEPQLENQEIINSQLETQEDIEQQLETQEIIESQIENQEIIDPQLENQEIINSMQDTQQSENISQMDIQQLDQPNEINNQKIHIEQEIQNQQSDVAQDVEQIGNPQSDTEEEMSQLKISQDTLSSQEEPKQESTQSETEEMEITQNLSQIESNNDTIQMEQNLSEEVQQMDISQDSIQIDSQMEITPSETMHEQMDTQEIENKDIQIENHQSDIQIENDQSVIQDIQIENDQSDIQIENDQSVIQDIQIVHNQSDIQIENDQSVIQDIQIVHNQSDIQIEVDQSVTQDIQIENNQSDIQIENDQSVIQDIQIVNDQSDIQIENDQSVIQDIQIENNQSDVQIENDQSDIQQTGEQPQSPEIPTSNESTPNSPDSIDSDKNEQKKINAALQNEKILQLLHDWDDADTDSQQSFSKAVTPVAPNNRNSINKLIDDWEDEEET